MFFPSIKVIAAFTAAHMWYSMQCCGGQDCHPLPFGAIQELKDGVLVPGFPLISYSDPRLHWSEDDQDHICVTPAKNLVCVYRRPKEF